MAQITEYKRDLHPIKPARFWAEWRMGNAFFPPGRTTFILIYKSIFIKVLDGNLGSFNLYLYHISDFEGR